MPTKKRKSKVGHSKRADIFRDLLPHINTSNYDYDGRYWVFGASSVWEILTESAHADEDSAPADAIRRVIGDLKLHEGRTNVATRVSLGSPHPFKTKAFDNLTPEQRQVIGEALQKFLSEVSEQNQRSHVSEPSDASDSIDAAFAEELVGKLPKIVERALPLENLDIAQIPDENTKLYFEEAHRCYLYGFNVACAVLCRALLASSLESLLDPQHVIENNPSRRKSYFEELVENAKTLARLKHDRPQWAICIRDAGNSAIHNLPKFNERWRGKLDEILKNTRKILIDLYAEPDA